MNQIVAKNLPHISITLRPNARARRITLRRSVRRGGFTVSYPRRLSIGEVQSFVNDHEGWLIKHHEPIEAVAFGQTIRFRGKNYEIVQGERRGVHFGDNHITIKSQHLGKSLAAALKIQAQSYALPKVDYYAEMVYSHANKVKWRDPKSRWGSCDSKGNLMFSWRLIMAPDWVFDYVIAHECAHLVHMDHSPRFWALVEEIYPDYARAKAYLRREGSSIQRLSFEGV